MLVKNSLLAVAASALAAGCSSNLSQSTVTGINVDNSNIGSEDLRGRSVTELKLLPNTKVPKGFVVSLMPGNQTFVRALYKKVHAINVGDGLAGMDGPDQEITMIIVNQSDELWNNLQQDLRSQMGLSSSAAVPYLARIRGSNDRDLWMQDWGEFAAVRVEGYDRVVHAVMDGGRGIGRMEADFFADVLKIPFLNVSGTGPVGSGNFGGNTEATHEGKLYYGDRLRDQTMLDRLRSLGNADAIEIPSDWLLVGHVDEYSTYIPARNSCGAALVIASPVEAMNLLAKASAPELTGTGLAVPAKWADSLQYFLKTEAGTLSGSNGLEDFDWSREPRIGYETDAEVQINLRWETLIREGAARLRNGSNCAAEIVSVPQLFRFEGSRAIATLGGATNMLVLRDHLIIPEPWLSNKYRAVEAFKQVIRSKLGEKVGGEDRVDFIDTTPYHLLEGEIHCGTNVIHELNMDTKIH